MFTNPENLVKTGPGHFVIMNLQGIIKKELTSVEYIAHGHAWQAGRPAGWAG